MLRAREPSSSRVNAFWRRPAIPSKWCRAPSATLATTSRSNESSGENVTTTPIIGPLLSVGGTLVLVRSGRSAAGELQGQCVSLGVLGQRLVVAGPVHHEEPE